MKATIMALLIATCVPPAGGAAEGESGGEAWLVVASGDAAIIEGKLVVDSADKGTFTLDGMAQTYVAPDGIDLEALDGQSVTVEIDGDGKVNSIAPSTEAPSVTGETLPDASDTK